MTTFKKEVEIELREIIKDKKTTELNKSKFITELKNGLGEEIKNNPGKLTFVKKTKFQKFVAWLKKFFVKF